MWILIAEMLLALGIIVFIMWWTLRARVDHPVPESTTEPEAIDNGQKAQSVSKTQIPED